MTGRHMFAYAILLVCLIGVAALWYFIRRGRQVEPHLRIDLLDREPEAPPRDP